VRAECGEKMKKLYLALAAVAACSVVPNIVHAEDTIADTVVVINRKVLGKPRDEAEAIDMLSQLAGREHTVITAVAVARGKKLRSSVEEVQVRFRHLRDEEIAAYVATGEPMDKAGAYGIQGYGATIVERIEGDYFAVMGLPLVRLVSLLRDLGINYRFGEPLTLAD